MKTVSRIMAGIAIGVWAGGSATAQKDDELTVTGLHMIETPIGINYTGMKVKDVSLSYTVDLKDLDLTTVAGVMELNERVGIAAHAACMEIERLYPISHPDTPRCAKTAAERTLAQIHLGITPMRSAETG